MDINIESILTSIKKLHGIEEADTSFDTDIMFHINSAFMILCQLGVGPEEGFTIDDSTPKWTDYIPNKFVAASVKSFVYIKVRLVFDPPASPTVVEALRESAKEYEWRIREWAEKHPN